MNFAPAQLVQFFNATRRVAVGGGADRQGDQDLVGVQAGVMIAQMRQLQVLNGGENLGGDQLDLLGDTRQPFERVEQASGGGAQQGGRLSCHDFSIRQFNGDGRGTGPGGALAGGGDAGAVCRGDARLLHQQFNLFDLCLTAHIAAAIAQRRVIAADDFVFGRVAHNIVVHDALADGVDAHIRRGLVGAFSHNALEHGAQDGVNFHVAVIVDGRLAVRLQVERVDHIQVVQVGGRRFVGDVQRVVERDIPHRERLKLGIARADTVLVIVINVGKAGCHFAAAGTGRGDDDQGTRRLNVLVFAVALIADDGGDVVRVAGDGVMTVDLETEVGQLFLKREDARLFAIARQHNASHVQPEAAERVDQAKHVQVIGDAEVAAHLVFLDVRGVDGNDDFRLVLELEQHADFGIRGKARQNAGGVIVVEQLASEFEIELAAEAGNAFADLFRLDAEVFVVVKADSVHSFCLSDCVLR